MLGYKMYVCSLDLVGTATFLKWLCQFTLLPPVYDNSAYSTSLSVLDIVCFFHLCV